MNLVKSLWTTGLFGLLGLIYFAYENYIFNLIWDSDFTKITFVVMALFVLGYSILGYKIFKNKIHSEDDLDIGYEICDIATSLGLLGTLIGISLAMKAFKGVDFDSPAEIKKLISHVGGGMSIALFTTLSGLVTQIVLRAAYYFTGSALIKSEGSTDEK